MMGTATNVARLWLWSLALFVATLWLHTRHNDFPYYYHTDEPGKVEQVMGRRPLNYHHPMLLLGTAQLATGNVRTEQKAVEVGRTVSAGFTAGAVVVLSLLAYLWRGWPMALTTGLALMLHHQLFELSHYMKEDTALLFGVAVTFLGLFLFDRRPGIVTAALTGVGCGLAISGKYAGVVILFPVLPVLLWPGVKRRGAMLAAAGAAMLLVLLAINFQLIRGWATASASLARETKLVVEGQGMTQSVPHSRYWSIFLANTTPVMWVLILAALWASWHRRRELRPAEWCVVLFPFLFAIILSFSPKENDRYFLPATALFTVLAVSGAGEIYRAMPSQLRQREKACELVACLLLLVAQFPSWTDDRGGLIRYWQAFQRDDTQELADFLIANVPAGGLIATDEKVRLTPGKGRGAEKFPFKILDADYAADIPKSGTVEELIRMGVSHVVITDSTFLKFERSSMRPKKNELEQYERRRQFYLNLRRDFAPLRDWRRGTVVYLHPGLEVYQINVAE